MGFRCRALRPEFACVTNPGNASQRMCARMGDCVPHTPWAHEPLGGGGGGDSGAGIPPAPGASLYTDITKATAALVKAILSAPGTRAGPGPQSGGARGAAQGAPDGDHGSVHGSVTDNVAGIGADGTRDFLAYEKEVRARYTGVPMVKGLSQLWFAQPDSTRAVRSRKRAVKFFGWVFFLISSGSPHVRCTPMARTCGEPDEIELTAMGVKLNGSRCRRSAPSISPLTGSGPCQSGKAQRWRAIVLIALAHLHPRPMGVHRDRAVRTSKMSNGIESAATHTPQYMYYRMYYRTDGSTYCRLTDDWPWKSETGKAYRRKVCGALTLPRDARYCYV